jgi:hypothetical protein
VRCSAGIRPNVIRALLEAGPFSTMEDGTEHMREPSMVVYVALSVCILVILPAALILCGVCGTRIQNIEYTTSDTPDEALSSPQAPFANAVTQAEQKIAADIASLEEGRHKGLSTSSIGSGSPHSMKNRFQGPEAQDALYGAAQRAQANINLSEITYLDETKESRFGSTPGAQVSTTHPMCLCLHSAERSKQYKGF